MPPQKKSRLTNCEGSETMAITDKTAHRSIYATLLRVITAIVTASTLSAAELSLDVEVKFQDKLAEARVASANKKKATILVIDRSGSMYMHYRDYPEAGGPVKWEPEKTRWHELLGQVENDLRSMDGETVGIVVFSGDIHRQTFAVDGKTTQLITLSDPGVRDAVLEAINKTPPAPVRKKGSQYEYFGLTRLYDALGDACKFIQTQLSDFDERRLILYSDGRDSNMDNVGTGSTEYTSLEMVKRAYGGVWGDLTTATRMETRWLGALNDPLIPADIEFGKQEVFVKMSADSLKFKHPAAVPDQKGVITMTISADPAVWKQIEGMGTTVNAVLALDGNTPVVMPLPLSAGIHKIRLPIPEKAVRTDAGLSGSLRFTGFPMPASKPGVKDWVVSPPKHIRVDFEKPGVFTLRIVPPPAKVLAGDEVVFVARASEADAAVEWVIDGEKKPGDTVRHKITKSTTYKVSARKDGFRSPEPISGRIEAVEASVKIKDPGDIYEGDEVTIALAQSVGPIEKNSIEWYVDGNPVKKWPFRFVGTGTRTVKVSAQVGGLGYVSDTLDVAVKPAPVLDLEALADDRFKADSEITFKVKATGGFAEVAWDVNGPRGKLPAAAAKVVTERAAQTLRFPDGGRYTVRATGVVGGKGYRSEKVEFDILPPNMGLAIVSTHQSSENTPKTFEFVAQLKGEDIERVVWRVKDADGGADVIRPEEHKIMMSGEDGSDKFVWTAEPKLGNRSVVVSVEAGLKAGSIYAEYAGFFADSRTIELKTEGGIRIVSPGPGATVRPGRGETKFIAKTEGVLNPANIRWYLENPLATGESDRWVSIPGTDGKETINHAFPATEHRAIHANVRVVAAMPDGMVVYDVVRVNLRTTNPNPRFTVKERVDLNDTVHAYFPQEPGDAVSWTWKTNGIVVATMPGDKGEDLEFTAPGKPASIKVTLEAAAVDGESFPHTRTVHVLYPKWIPGVLILILTVPFGFAIHRYTRNKMRFAVIEGKTGPEILPETPITRTRLGAGNNAGASRGVQIIIKNGYYHKFRKEASIPIIRFMSREAGKEWSRSMKTGREKNTDLRIEKLEDTRHLIGPYSFLNDVSSGGNIRILNPDVDEKIAYLHARIIRNAKRDNNDYCKLAACFAVYVALVVLVLHLFC